MKKILQDSINTMERLNNYVNKKIVNESTIQEERENINDFAQLQEKIGQHLEKINNLNVENIEDVQESFCNTHLLIMDYYWHLDQPKMLIEKFIGKYRELIELKDTGKSNDEVESTIQEN